MSSSHSPTPDPIQIPLDARRRAGEQPPNRMPPPAPSFGRIRVGVTKEIVPLLRGFGADPDEVIREAGLDPALFDDENNIIPYVALGHILARCVARTHCPHFGLLVGQRGALSAIARSAG